MIFPASNGWSRKKPELNDFRWFAEVGWIHCQSSTPFAGVFQGCELAFADMGSSNIFFTAEFAVDSFACRVTEMPGFVRLCPAVLACVGHNDSPLYLYPWNPEIIPGKANMKLPQCGAFIPQANWSILACQPSEKADWSGLEWAVTVEVSLNK